MPATGKRRALGQHFLKDRALAETIAEIAVSRGHQAGCQTLLEIGPGRGAITLPLAAQLATHGIHNFILSERDRELARQWSERRHEFPGMRVEEGDFLELPEEKWLSQAPLAVASNLPYSAGTAIVSRLARHPESIPVMVLMFQAEVAARLRAMPGTKSWGSLSVWIQNYWDVQKLASVPPGAFSPPPDVDSEVVVLTPRAPRVPAALRGPEAQKWESLLKACFAHRRKMLRSGLSSSETARNALVRSGVDGTKRAEALSWEEWNRLFAALPG
ncbi:MAG: ribosomal RNA small subunit methyltransferase A [Bdellovibrionales bacterium GWB1_55_8]|nr:MAG: ribosomal RNA small subunit methyltransferase A [Bdellovibrionales bacterium GWB1_55_8]